MLTNFFQQDLLGDKSDLCADWFSETAILLPHIEFANYHIAAKADVDDPNPDQQGDQPGPPAPANQSGGKETEKTVEAPRRSIREKKPAQVPTRTPSLSTKPKPRLKSKSKSKDSKDSKDSKTPEPEVIDLLGDVSISHFVPFLFLNVVLLYFARTIYFRST